MRTQKSIVPVTCNFLDLQFEVSTFPEVEGVDGSFIFKLRLHSTHDLIKDLLAKLVEEYTTLVLRIGRILYNIDVCIVGEFTFTSTSKFFVCISTRVPQFTVGLTNGTLTTDRSEAVFNQPTTGTLESMVVYLCPRKFFTFDGREETNDRITVTGLIYLGFPETVIRVRLLFSFSTSFTSFWVREPSLDCFFRSEKDIWIWPV